MGISGGSTGGIGELLPGAGGSGGPSGPAGEIKGEFYLIREGVKYNSHRNAGLG
jgi:hypothetical protein